MSFLKTCEPCPWNPMTKKGRGLLCQSLRAGRRLRDRLAKTSGLITWTKHLCLQKASILLLQWSWTLLYAEVILSYCSSVQFICSVMSNSLWPHRLWYARLPCPSPTTGVYSNSSPLSWWCHPTISSSVFPFSSCLPSFQASGSFEMSQFFTSRGPHIGISASASVLPMKHA